MQKSNRGLIIVVCCCLVVTIAALSLMAAMFFYGRQNSAAPQVSVEQSAGGGKGDAGHAVAQSEQQQAAQPESDGVGRTLVLNAWGGRTEMDVEIISTGEKQTHGFGATVFSRDYEFTYREEYVLTDNANILSCTLRHEDGTIGQWEVYTADVIETVDLPEGEEPQVNADQLYFFMHPSDFMENANSWAILHNPRKVSDNMTSDELFDMPVERAIYAQANWNAEAPTQAASTEPSGKGK